MIAKRIPHKTQCDHAQTPYQRRKCRAAKLAAATTEAKAAAERERRAARLAALGYASEQDVLDAYSEATDELAQLAGDHRERFVSHWVRQRDEARAAIAELGITAPSPRRRFGRRAA